MTVKITFLCTICRNFDMFRFILIIFRKLLCINKAYIQYAWIINYIKYLCIKCQ